MNQSIENIKKIYNTLLNKHIKSTIVVDEGRTEVKENSVTALGVEVVDKEKVKEIFSEYKLYRW